METTQINWPGWMLSSTGEGISLRIKGFMSSIIPLVVLVTQFFGHPILGADLNDLTSSLTLIVTSVWAIFSGMMFVAGWVRNNFMRENKLGVYSPEHPRFGAKS